MVNTEGLENSSIPETEKSGRYALLSVSDKTGIVGFAKTLDKLGYKIISTGGTAKALEDGGLNVVPIQDITGNPESFDGRMKTISFQAEGGILFDRTNPSHVQQAKELGIKNIDIVVANLYPFEQTVARSDVTMDEAVESIDVGGPTMERAGGKNYKNVLTIVDPADYERVAEVLESGSVSEDMRRELASKVFNHLSFYDSQIGRYLGQEQFPKEMTLPGRRAELTLRYGDNSHQKAAIYFEPGSNSPLQRLKKLAGQDLSKTNFTDIAAGLESVRIFKEPMAAVIKHNSPCGLALGNSMSEALLHAVEADPESAFGGVVVLNGPIDLEAAKTFASFKEERGVQMDIVAATDMTDEARDFIRGVRKRTGIYTFGEIPEKRSNPNQVTAFDGGVIVQDWDDDPERSFSDWIVATIAQPTDEQVNQMKLAWKFISRIKSNTVIVVDKDLPMTRGIGSGQTSRVRSTDIALEQAGGKVRGAILASDSFFPFGDSVAKAVEKGIGAIIQQGGSIRDQESIDVANSAGIPMVFTGERKFWH